MANNNKRKPQKRLTAKNKKLVIIIMSVVVAVSILTSLVFGFKLYAFGKDITVTYVLRGGNLTSTTQTVEVCKKYKLPTPTHQDRDFLYWSLDVAGKQKVEMSGIWFETTQDVTLYANWGSAEYTENY